MKHNERMYEPDTSLARIDAIAAAKLSGKLLVRYEAYKQVLLAREQDHTAIVSTLTLFVSDLSDASDRCASITGCGSGAWATQRLPSQRLGRATS